MLTTSNILKNRARLVLAGAVLAASLTACKDDEINEPGSHNWEINGNTIVNIKPERKKMLRNPMTGWVMYAGIGDGLDDRFWEVYDNFPSAVGNIKVSDYSNVLYVRGAWSDFNPEEGKYIWNDGQVDSKPAKRYKMLVDEALRRGMKLAFTFVVDSQDKHYDFTPKYVKDAGAKGFVTTTGSVQVWSPYCDDPIFQEKYEQFVRDFAAKYNDPNVTEFISGFGMGKWGESHTVWYSTGDNEPREAVIDWVSDVYTKYVTKVPLVINYHRCLMLRDGFSASVVNPRTEPVLLKLIEKGYSLRHDAFGMKTYYTTWERGFAASQRYKRPIIMEGGWVEGSHGGSIKGDGYANYAEVRQGEYNEGKGANVNMMDLRYSKNTGTSETHSWFNAAYNLVEEFIAEGGYRLYPDKISLPTTVSGSGNATFVHRWSNLGWGYCPTNIPQWNQKYKVAFALLDKTTSLPVKIYVDETPCLNEWIKGKPSTYEFTCNLGGVTPGSYIWAVGIVDTTQDNKIGIYISAKGDITEEGWVKLSDVNVN